MLRVADYTVWTVYTETVMSEPTRQKILDAATTVVLTKGVLHLTLAAVAEKAGVSKGGLLYHFPSKEALVAGLMEQYARTVSDGLASREVKQTVLEAYVEATLSLDEPSRRLEAALLAAILLNPELINPLRERFLNLQAAITADADNPALATLIRLAVDGLWLTDLLGLASPQGEERVALRDYIKGLLERGV